MSETAKTLLELLAETPSKYHRFRQGDGRGFGILRLDALGSIRATVVAADLAEDDANTKLAAYRREE